MRRKIIFIFIIILSTYSFAQKKEGRARADSLIAKLPVMKEDLKKAYALFEISQQYFPFNRTEAIKYGELYLSTSKILGDKQVLATAHYNMADLYWKSESFGKAIEHSMISLELNEQIGNVKGIAQNYNIHGLVLLAQKNYAESAKKILQSLAINEELNQRDGAAHNYSNLAIVYQEIDKNDLSREYSLKGLKIASELGMNQLIYDNTYRLGFIYNSLGNYAKAIEYFTVSLQLAVAEGDNQRILNNTSTMGSVYRNQGDYPKSIDAHLKSLALAEKTGVKQNLAYVNRNLSELYNTLSDYPKAIQYGSAAIKLYEELGVKTELAAQYINIGNSQIQVGLYKESLEYFLKALEINIAEKNDSGIATAHGSIGIVYFYLGDYGKAVEYYKKGLAIDIRIGSKLNAARSYGNIGEGYFELAKANPSDRQKHLPLAVEYLQKGMAECREMGALKEYEFFSGVLSDVYAFDGQYDKALKLFKQHTRVKDSLFNMEKTKDFSRRELQYEFGKKQDSLKLESTKKELEIQREMQLSALRYEFQKKQALATTERERQQLRYEEQIKRQQIESSFREKQEALASAQERKDIRNNAERERQKSLFRASLAGSILLLIAALSAGFAFWQKRKANRIIAREKQRSEELLLNILPAEVAEELKNKGLAEARQYNQVSVLFTDFVNFTQIAERMSPQDIVRELHECFTAFDTIIERNGLEKIKTIGDAYMAVSGLPKENPLHAQNAVRAAIEIRDCIDTRNKNNYVYEIRVGINSGSVVAGIVGIKKFAFDIWGDAVNVAARMESSGHPGKVNISQNTYELVKDDFEIKHRGKLDAKNKGCIDMYFAELKGC